jgi:uncharacterized protein YecE (DUF72 family)
MESRLQRLGEKLGPVLFQLPPQMKPDRERLATFLQRLNKRHRYAFEFRDRGWYEDGIFDLLRAENIALCISDHIAAPAPWIATASHVYVRGHGSSGRYRGHYDDATLADWAKNILAWHRQGRQVYAYFDNDEEGAAPIDADKLIARLGPAVAERPADAPTMAPLSPEGRALPAVILRDAWKRREAPPSRPVRSRRKRPAGLPLPRA